MPVEHADGGWRWGSHGKLYTGKGARRRAAAQGYAAMKHGYREQGESIDAAAKKLYGGK